ncbi:N-acetylmannosamine-6-phosphate 2-epimerase [Brevibacillus laterosporus]|nr:N-acetylmannosamine-6-phosphate 2-epimerase [Brevibacillus laterosporus]MBG9798740.1 N-acetylmannosamine-6-phosphate 2-epimerase [Brevibacillus laterosporus]NKQ18757.1 N-acetylmannosamine-6-phosphate 2-epimerase [Brevibacillus laterosporus]PPA87713.1 N-acetylmannosamine-6-phosphate 2-epimerase [Brevibacillus laterosporus]
MNEMTNEAIKAQMKHGLVVSCQALPDEPLHSAFIMGRMARAAEEGGAVGIRANTKEDIAEIKKQVNLPIMGIVKRDYPDSEIYITPTMKEIDELIEIGCEIIALDATDRIRPIGKTLEQFVQEVKEKYPHQLLMADIATLQEAKKAEELGFDFVSTTLVGYTPQSIGHRLYDNDFALLKEMLTCISVPMIAEGNILTPDMAKRCLELGVYAVVVGGAITRPQQITKRFVDQISKAKE